MATVLSVTDGTFNAEVQNSSLPVLADFYADWCAPCRQMALVLEKVAQELSGKLAVVKIDVEQNSILSQRFSILNLPTLILFVNGQPVEKVVGYRTLNQLKELAAKHLAI